jgi:hypothetical protein
MAELLAGIEDTVREKDANLKRRVDRKGTMLAQVVEENQSWAKLL